MWQINLIPEELQQNYKSRLVARSMAMTVVIVGLLIALVHMTLSWAVARLEGKPMSMSAAFVDTELASLKNKYNRLLQEKDALYREKGPLIEVVLFSYPYGDILNGLAHRAAEKVWLEEVQMNSKIDICELNGKSFNTRLVSEFMLELKKMPYFSDLALTYLEKNQKRSGIFDFKIECKYR